MAALTITAAQVLPGANAVVEQGTAGATITAGMSVYKDSADNNHWKPADADSTGTAITAGSAGLSIALHGASDGQPLRVQTGGDEITLGAGAAPAQGTVYVVGVTGGAIAPESDLASGDRLSILGVGDGTSKLKLCMKATGVAHA